MTISDTVTETFQSYSGCPLAALEHEMEGILNKSQLFALHSELSMIPTTLSPCPTTFLPLAALQTSSLGQLNAFPPLCLLFLCSDPDSAGSTQVQSSAKPSSRRQTTSSVPSSPQTLRQCLLSVPPLDCKTQEPRYCFVLMFFFQYIQRCLVHRYNQ